MSAVEQIRNAGENASRLARIVYHAGAAAVVRVRLEGSEHTAERMEHKQELYSQLGRLARTGAAPTERPRTIVERVVDLRLDRRAQKKIYQDNEASLNNKTFGKDKRAPVSSVRQSVVDRGLSIMLPGRGVQDGVAKSVKRNTSYLFTGADIPGKTPLRRKIDYSINTMGFWRGKKTARQRRDRSVEITATDPKYGGKTHRRIRRNQRRATEHYEQAEEMPISSAWRTQRLWRAEKRARKQRAKIQAHRTALQNLHK